MFYKYDDTLYVVVYFYFFKIFIIFEPHYISLCVIKDIQSNILLPNSLVRIYLYLVVLYISEKYSISYYYFCYDIFFIVFVIDFSYLIFISFFIPNVSD